jgi:hypothetical protein
MAQIPADQKFHTLNANTPTQERGSAQADGLREIYTMQDIIDSVGGGGGGVSSLKSLTGDLNLVGAGTVTVTDNGSDTITVTGSGGGDGIIIDFVVRQSAFASLGDHEGTVTTLVGLTPTGTGLVNYWNGAAWIVANASTPASSTGLMGLSTGTVGVHLTNGVMQLTTAPGSAGDVLYLDTTNQLLTATPPSGSGEVVRVCGYNIGNNRVYFNPSADWIVLP